MIQVPLSQPVVKFAESQLVMAAGPGFDGPFSSSLVSNGLLGEFNDWFTFGHSVEDGELLDDPSNGLNWDGFGSQRATTEQWLLENLKSANDPPIFVAENSIEHCDDPLPAELESVATCWRNKRFYAVRPTQSDALDAVIRRQTAYPGVGLLVQTWPDASDWNAQTVDRTVQSAIAIILKAYDGAGFVVGLRNDSGARMQSGVR